MISIRPTLDGSTYGRIDLDSDIPILLFDHLGGFALDQTNEVLEQLNECTQEKRLVYCEYIFSDRVRQHYPKLQLNYNTKLWMHGNNIGSLTKVKNNQRDFQNFVCTFNYGPHISRKLLTAHLIRRSWLDTNFSSKNFVLHSGELIALLYELVGARAKWMQKHFIQSPLELESPIYQQIFSFGSNDLDHGLNLDNLKPVLDGSFLHIVSETMATSYYPFVTEKFFYSVANQGLFLAYAQPGWHKHVLTYFGFKRYDKIFNYDFDRVLNPVDRLIALTDMLSKYSRLNRFDWHDLYLIEKDTILHNYYHWASGKYLEQLNQTTGQDPMATANINNI